MSKRKVNKVEVRLNPELGMDLTKQAYYMIQEEFVDKVLYMAMDESPFDTGTNRRSIFAKFVSKAKGLMWKIGTESHYGGYLELGTAKMPARPYFAPAIKRALEQMRRKGKNNA